MRPGLFNLFLALSILLLVAFSQSISWDGAQMPQRDNRPRRASISWPVTIAGNPVVNAVITVVETDLKPDTGRVGVPGVQNSRVFDDGGVMPSFSRGPTIIIESITLYHGISQSGAEELVAVGMSGRNGERIIANKLAAMRTRGKAV